MVARFRSAAGLWQALAGNSPRAGANWWQLCELGSVDTLVGAMALRDAADGIRFATWNVRWLLSPMRNELQPSTLNWGAPFGEGASFYCKKRTGH